MAFGELVDDHRANWTMTEPGEGVADRTYSDYKSRHNRLKDEFSSIKLIAFSHIDHWETFNVSKASRRYENHARILFNYAVERGYLNSSPMIGETLDAPKLNKPAILRETNGMFPSYRNPDEIFLRSSRLCGLDPVHGITPRVRG